MARYAVHFEDLALRNLQELHDHIADGPPQAPRVAERFIDALIVYCEATLSLAPFSGQARDDIRPGLRTTHYKGSTVIAFVAERERELLHIIGVFYGGRQWERLLQDD